jgi:LysM repeat protein
MLSVRGDTLSKIARRCGTTLSALLEANPDIANPDRVLVGQRIALEAEAIDQPVLNVIYKPEASASGILIQLQGFPARSAVQIFLAPQPESGEPEYQIVNTIRTDEAGTVEIITDLPEPSGEGVWIVGAALRNRPRDNEMLTKSLQISTDTQLVHIVQRGERLSRIASRYDTNVTSIMKKNTDILNPHRIFVGQEILIPGPDEQYPDEPFMPVAANPRLDITSIVGNQVDEDERWIDVDVSSQTVHAYEGKELVRSFLVSTGKARNTYNPRPIFGFTLN